MAVIAPKLQPMLALVIITPFVVGIPFAAIAMRNTEELPQVNSNQMHIRLADIENDSLLECKTMFTVQDLDWGNSVTQKWSPYAPIMLEIRESGIIPGRVWADGTGEYSPSIDCQIYRLRFAWMADGVMDDLHQKYEDYGREPIVDETGLPGFDRLYVRGEQFWQEVFACKGGIVIHLRYYGDREIQSVIDAVSEFLARG